MTMCAKFEWDLDQIWIVSNLKPLQKKPKIYSTYHQARHVVGPLFFEKTANFDDEKREDWSTIKVGKSCRSRRILQRKLHLVFFCKTQPRCSQERTLPNYILAFVHPRGFRSTNIIRQCRFLQASKRFKQLLLSAYMMLPWIDVDF